mgnify:CR=1 FL=1
MSKPNVVVFISHDTGRFLSTYGYDTVDTPNFERLARMGTTFDNVRSPCRSAARRRTGSG